MKLRALPIAQIRHKPLMAILPILLFALGVGLLLLMARVDERLSGTLERNLAGVDLVLGAKGSPLQLVLSSLYHADNPTGNISLGDIRPYLIPKHRIIKESLPVSTGDNYKGFRIIGSDHKILDWYGATLADGQNFSHPLEVVLGAQVVKELNIKIGDQFSSTHGLDAASDHQHEDKFTVVGILKPTGTVLDRLILTQIQSYWQTHDHDEHEQNNHEDHDHHDHGAHKKWSDFSDDKTITALLLRYRGMNHMALNLARSINDKTPLQAAAPNIEIGRLYALTGSSLRVARYVSYVIIVVSALSLFIALFTVLHGRLKELALLRGIGARRHQLFTLILSEGIVIALAGIVGGIILSRILDQLITSRIAALGPIKAWIQAESWIVLGALVIAVIAAIIPAWMASRVEVADQL